MCWIGVFILLLSTAHAVLVSTSDDSCACLSAAHCSGMLTLTLALASWCACLPTDKEENDQLFETMDANDLNKRMKDFMPDLSVKVFRWVWAACGA